MSHRVIAIARTAAVAVAHAVAYAVLWLILWVVVPAFVLQWSPAVLTGDSMQPGLDAGDVVLASPHSGVGLEAGVVVLYEDPTTGGLTTHRIIAVEDDGSYRTKGDSNVAADSTLITPDSIRGVGRLAVPWIGLPRLWAQTGNLAALGAFVAVVLAIYGRPVVVWVRRRRMAHAEQASAREVPVVAADSDIATPNDGSWEGMRHLLRRNLKRGPLTGFSDRLASSIGPAGLVELDLTDTVTDDAPIAEPGHSAVRPDPLERPRVRPMQKAALILLVIATSLLIITLAPVQTANALFIGTTAPGGGSMASDTLDPPTGLSADTSTAGQVDLSWTPTGDTYATGYQIYRSETSGSGYSLVDTVAGSGTSAYSDVFTPDKRTYYYKIRAYYGAWTSVYSNEATADVGYDGIIKATSGLVGYWRLGLTTTTSVAPDDWGSNDGTPSGGFTPGVGGAIVGDSDTAASFNGSSGDVLIGNPAELQLNSGSVEAWIRTPDAGTGYREIVSKEDVFYLAARDNILGVFDDGSNSWRSTGVAIDDDVWHHVVLRYQSGVSNGTRIYLDGNLVLTTTLTALAQNQPIHFGTWDGTDEHWAGRIDEVAIYNTLLSPTDIGVHYQAGSLAPPTGLSADTSTVGQVDLSWTPTVDTYATGYRIYRSETSGSGYALVDTVAGSGSSAYSDVFTPDKRSYYYVVRAYYGSWESVNSNEATADVGYDGIIKATSGLVSYWRLGANTTTSVAPDSWGSNDGTPSGGFTPGVGGAIVGDSDTAASFNGSSGNVSIGNPADLQLNTGTIEVWIRTSDAGTGYREIVSKDDAYFLAARDNILGVYDDGSNNWRSTGVAIDDGAWHHVVMRYQSGVSNGTRIYLDGTVVLATTLTVDAQNLPIHFGSWAGTSEHWAGRIDEVAIYNTLLSPSDIDVHHQAGLNP